MHQGSLSAAFLHVVWNYTVCFSSLAGFSQFLPGLSALSVLDPLCLVVHLRWCVCCIVLCSLKYVQQSAITSAAETAAVRNTTKYSSLSGTHDFFPVALETLGPMSVSAQEFLTQIGRRSTDATTDPRETTFLFQHLSFAVQRGLPGRHVSISESTPWPFQTWIILIIKYINK